MTSWRGQSFQDDFILLEKNLVAPGLTTSNKKLLGARAAHSYYSETFETFSQDGLRDFYGRCLGASGTCERSNRQNRSEEPRTCDTCSKWYVLQDLGSKNLLQKSLLL